MRLLIDIGHPAHVHLFKNFAWRMHKKGHDVFFTCRGKEFEIDLLKTYGFNFKSFGKKYNSAAGKLWGMIEFDVKEFIASLKFRPDILLSHGSIYAAQCSFILRKPHISLEDTFNFEQIRLYLPFTSTVLTGRYEHPSLGKKEIQYAGYHELAYLHPKYFQPDKSIFQFLGLGQNEKYVILRFIAWHATHDYNHKGINYETKLKALREFEKFAHVFISSESTLPSELNKYRINTPPHKLHDVLAFSSLLFGESSTMAEECAILGVPSCFIYNKSTYYTKHLENKYQLLFNYSESIPDQGNAIKKCIELLQMPNLKEEWERRRQKLLSDHIDVTAFMIWFVENYPESKRIMKENPKYTERFK